MQSDAKDPQTALDGYMKSMLSGKVENAIEALSSILRNLFGHLSSTTIEIFNSLQSLRDTTLGLQEDIRILTEQYEKNHDIIHKTFPVDGGFRTFVQLVDVTIENVLEITTTAQLTILPVSNNFFQRLSSFTASSTNLEGTIKETDNNLQSLAKLFPFFVSLLSCSGFEKTAESFDLEEAISRIAVEPFWYKQHSSLQQFRELLYITYVTVGESTNHDPQLSPLVRHFSTLKSAVHYSLDRQKVFEKIKQVHNSMDIHFLKQVWNLPDEPLIAKLSGFNLPSVSLSQVFFIPVNEGSDLKAKWIKCRIISATLPIFPLSHLKLDDRTEVDQSSTTLMSRMLSSLSLASVQQTNASDSQHTVPIIFHMHGGGFVSGSTQMHENYLREWAKITDAVIISIDYSLGPESKFPTALEECFYAYKWIVSGNLGTNVGKIIVAGDSAGGNLAIGITLKCLENNVRTPDCLLLAYPSVDMTATLYPSRLLFVNDPIVPAKAAKLCRDSYLPSSFFTNSEGSSQICNTDLLLDHYLSPLYAPASLLSRFPLTLIALAQYDPLLDEGLLFAEKLKRLERQTFVKQYLGLPHGFLSTAAYMPQAVTAVKELGLWIKEHL